MTDVLLFRILITQAWQIALLAVIVAVTVRFTARRTRVAWWLWLVVVVKCVTPPVWGHSFGLFSRLQVLTIWPNTADAEPAISHSIDARLAAGCVYEFVPPELSADAVVYPVDLAAEARIPEHSGTRLDRRSVMRPETSSNEWWAPALIWILTIGAAASGILLFSRFFRCVCQIRRQRVGEFDGEVEILVSKLARQLKLRRVPRVIVSEVRFGPAVLGVFRPVIVLPRCLVADAGCQHAQVLRPILAHELLHIRRGDLLTGTLQAVVYCLWWFHPVVWAVNRLLSRETERCCDEDVIAELGCSPMAYARSLLAVIECKQSLKPVPVFPGMKPVEITSNRMERIMSLKQGSRKRMPWWSAVAVLGFALVVLPGAVIGHASDEAPTETLEVEPDDDEQGTAIRQEAGPVIGTPPNGKTIRYPVRRLIDRLMSEHGLSEQEAREQLLNDVQQAAGESQKEPGENPLSLEVISSDNPKTRYTARVSSLFVFDGDELVVTHSPQGQERLRKFLDGILPTDVDRSAEVTDDATSDRRLKQVDEFTGDTVVAKVNGLPICVDDLVGSIRLSIEANAQISPKQRQRILKSQVKFRLDRYIEQEILLQALEKSVPQERRIMIDQSLEAPFQRVVANIREDKHLQSNEELERSLGEEGLSIDQLRERYLRTQKAQIYLSTLIDEKRPVESRTQVLEELRADAVVVTMFDEVERPALLPQTRRAKFGTGVKRDTEVAGALVTDDRQVIKVLGAVRNPGVCEVASDAPVTLLGAIAAAGGLDGSVDDSVVLRRPMKSGATSILLLSIKRAKLEPGKNPTLRPGDVIVVEKGRPPKGISPVQRKMNDALNRAISISCSGEDYHDVLRKLATIANVNIVIDMQSFRVEQTKHENGQRVCLDFQNVPLAKVLDVLCSQLGLEYETQNEVIHIRSLQPVPKRYSTRVYRVADLITSWKDAKAVTRSRPSTSPAKKAVDENGDEDPLRHSRATNEQVERDRHQEVIAADAAKSEFDSLIELITTTIEPDTWGNDAGRVSAERSVFGLVVRQTEDVHDQIAELLAQLRKMVDIKVTTRVYNVADLVVPVPGISGAAFPEIKNGSLVPARPPVRAAEVSKVAYSELGQQARFAPLIELLKATVSPDSWEETGKIDADQGTLSLIVRQTGTAHRQIGKLLGQLRRELNRQVTLECLLFNVSSKRHMKALHDRVMFQDKSSSRPWALLTPAKFGHLMTDAAGFRGAIRFAPKVTLFNNQQSTVSLSDDPGVTVRLTPYVYPDDRLIRLMHSVGFGANPELQQFTQSSFLRTGQTLLVDVTRRGEESTVDQDETNNDRLLLAITAKVNVWEELPMNAN